MLRRDISKAEWPAWTKRIRSRFSEFSEAELLAVDADWEKLSTLFQRKFGWSDIRTDRTLAEIFG